MAGRSWQGLKELQQKGRALFHLADRNPLIGGVRLGDIAGTEHHARDAAASEDRGIAEIIDPQRPGLTDDGKQRADERQSDIGLEGGTGSAPDAGKRALKFVGGEQGADFLTDGAFAFAGQGAPIDVDGAAVRDNVGL